MIDGSMIAAVSRRLLYLIFSQLLSWLTLLPRAPARKALRAVMGKVKTWCRQMDTNQPLEVLLLRLNQMLRGWCAHFRPGVSSATFAYLSAYTWARVIGWLRRKHRRITWKELRRRYCAGGWWPGTTERVLFNPAKVPTTRYRYRGAAIPAAWPVTG